jgi:hypothetical protein
MFCVVLQKKVSAKHYMTTVELKYSITVAFQLVTPQMVGLVKRNMSTFSAMSR